jgi:ketosteroid isomerase-like protein
MMRALLLLTLLTTAGAGSAQDKETTGGDTKAGGGVKNEVLRIEELRNLALQRGDVAALDRLYTDDLVYTNATGRVLTKAQHLTDIRTRKLRLTSLKHSDVEVRVHGTTGIVTGVSTSLVEYQGTVSSSPRRYVNVYVKDNGLWRCAVHFETPAAKQ